MIKSDVFKKALLGKPKATILDIWYQPDNGEAYVLALNVYWELRNASWNVLQQPMPIPRPPTDKEPTLPLSIRAGGPTWGVGVVAKEFPKDTNPEKSAAWALMRALSESIESPSGTAGSDDKDFPNDKLRIIVGAKP
jgi:hypothetical protein